MYLHHHWLVLEMAADEDWSDDGTHTSSDADPWYTDENGIGFEFNTGFYLEPEPKTPWTFLASTFRLDTSQQYANERNPRGDYGFCASLLIRPELKPDPRRSFKWLAAPVMPTREVREDRMTRHAFSRVFDVKKGFVNLAPEAGAGSELGKDALRKPRRRRVTWKAVIKDRFRAEGLWGADDGDAPWILVFERSTVHPVLRGLDPGTRLAVRMLEEITSKARKARIPVIVLTMPPSPKDEVTDNTAGLSAVASRSGAKRASAQP